MLLTKDFDCSVRQLDRVLGVGHCFDVVARDLYAGRRRCRVYTIDGYGDGAVLERVLANLQRVPSTVEAQSMEEFIDRYVSFAQVDAESDLESAVLGVFLGKTLLLAEGFAPCALIDAKEYPARGVEEPSSGKVLRGAHDGM